MNSPLKYLINIIAGASCAGLFFTGVQAATQAESIVMASPALPVAVLPIGTSTVAPALKSSAQSSVQTGSQPFVPSGIPTLPFLPPVGTAAGLPGSAAGKVDPSIGRNGTKYIANGYVAPAPKGPEHMKNHVIIKQVLADGTIAYSDVLQAGAKIERTTDAHQMQSNPQVGFSKSGVLSSDVDHTRDTKAIKEAKRRKVANTAEDDNHDLTGTRR
jgi:hypothetical protein